jgi:hypothetical protein
MDRQTSKSMIIEAENDPSTSQWLKANLRLLDEHRDLVDVLNDLDFMKIVFELKFKELQKNN